MPVKNNKAAQRKALRTQHAQADSNSNKVQRSKANAQQTAQPGVIATIMSLLTEAKQKKKMYSFAHMHSLLCKAFPQRRAGGMVITLRAQLSRLPHEKDFAISKKQDGRITLYCAA